MPRTWRRAGSIGAIVLFASAFAVALAFVAPDRTGDRPIERRQQTFEAILTGRAELLPLALAVVFLLLTCLAAFVANRLWNLAGDEPESGTDPRFGPHGDEKRI